jgi:diacylglycerol kinase family enzyme
MFSWLKGKKKLTIKTNVQAEVYIDGEFLGVSPLTVEVSKGKHTLEIKKSGFYTIREIINITDDRSLYFTLREILKKLTIKTNVPALVYIDGVYKGETPLTVKVTTGEHTLKIEKDGYEPIKTKIDYCKCIYQNQESR